MIEKVLDQLPLTDHDTETTEAIRTGAKRLFSISSKKQRLNCGNTEVQVIVTLSYLVNRLYPRRFK